MLIRRKLQILSLATIAGLVVILVGVLWGLATMREASRPRFAASPTRCCWNA